MGSCLSGFAPPHLLDVVDGNEDDYQQRYLEEKVLGEGEFGVVKLVYDMHLQQKQKKKKTTTTITTTTTTSSSSGEVSDTPPSTTRPPPPPTPFACKILQKGVVFRDNVLYTPLKPEVLRGEIQMLRTLAGQCYCVSLIAVYESTKRLYVITECCTGGTMTQYVAASSMSSFTTMDVSRISYQLLLAIQHCAKYHIIHRDMKPDNIMFTHPGPGADVRVIDFGSGCMDDTTSTDNSNNSNNVGVVDVTVSTSTTSTKKKIEYINGQRIHTTFAGSAFYISPELYNRSYTLMTDIWSVGVTLYVLVAGYPADALQKAFNILQTDSRDLHTLPNIPNNDILPESFYTLLNGCLTYWYQHRPNATTLLQYEFVKLHQQLPPPQQVSPPKEHVNDTNETTLETTTEDDYDYYDNIGDDDDDDDDNDNDEAKISELGRMMSTKSYGTTMSHPDHSLRGSVLRHNIFLNFQQYERSLTALLATLLSKSELEQLVFVLNKRVLVRINGNGGIGGDDEDQFDMVPPSNNNNNMPATGILERSGIKEQQQLAVVPISELKAILYDDLLKGDILDQIDKLSLDKNQYDNFAYHTALLNDFVRNQAKNNKSDGLTSSAHFVRGRGGSIHQMTGSNASSVNSNSSMMMMRRGSNSSSNNNNLKNVFKSMSKKKSTTKSSSSSMKRSVSTSAF